MELDIYAILTDDHETYEFLSEGPKGTIRKIVVYQLVGGNFYNLAFGDWNEENLRLDDDTRSNNSDRDKVLATVANTVIDFVQYHPSATVHAKGSTPAKTRLYQMGINQNWTYINLLFRIKGLAEGVFRPFEQNKNYEAFLLEPKEKN